MSLLNRKPGIFQVVFCLALFSCGLQCAQAQTLRERIMERRAAQGQARDQLDDAGSFTGTASLPAGVRALRDVAYGSDGEQRMDVYLPVAASSAAAPVVLMAHGGGWRNGDKRNKRVIENKVARWVPRGVVLVSINYRMQNNATPLQEAEDMALALATAQGKAASWGADPAKFILMGHSAGAHLAALLSAAPHIARKAGAAPWLGAVALDSAAMDVPQIMNARHFGLYDRAFGTDQALWTAASPWHQLASGALPMLLVCSSKRADSCASAVKLQVKASSLGARAEVLPQAMTHGEINEQLGLDKAYTESVEAFMASLDPAIARLLATSARSAR